jgi:tetratricopeptide (TPR) repeat protein
MLALAVEASNRAPDESMRYAAFLAQDQKFLPAEEVLVNALRLKPEDQNLLRLLGRLYVQMKDWPRAEHIERTLAGLDSDAAKMAANEMKAQRLAAQNQDGDLLAFLGSLSAGGQGNAGVDVAIIRANMLRGDTAAALAQADKMLAADPANPALRFLRASVLVSSGKVEEGEAAIRAVNRDAPQYEPAWMALYNALYQRGDTAGAGMVLQEALAALPDSANLNWILAGERERAGDIDAAITIYEKLYERDSNALVVANNLASLLSTHRTDPESLERAYTVARRLRGSTIAPFQDTYGWIAYRRGAYDEALSHLEPAAKALAGDPAVQYHLAATYAALGRQDAALDLLRKVEGMTDPAPIPAVLEAVRAEIARLTAPAPTGQTGGATPPAGGN